MKFQNEQPKHFDVVGKALNSNHHDVHFGRVCFWRFYLFIYFFQKSKFSRVCHLNASMPTAGAMSRTLPVLGLFGAPTT